MKIVKFEDGRYALRKRILFVLWYVYKDLMSYDFWWDINSRFIEDCKTFNLDELKRRVDRGKPIN
jgi:hypothetical protein